MTGDDDSSHSRRRRVRTISIEEASLWHTVARSVTPLARLRHTLTRTMKDHGHHGAKAQVPEAVPPAPEGKSARPPTASVATTSPKSPPPRKAPPAPVGFDTRTARKVKSGKIDIDARLDLHGYRQAEAHVALKRFLVNAQLSGYRYVKVITGKGSPTETEDVYDMFSSAGRGVLKRSVPHWLAEPEFRSLVVRTTSAGRGQGGEGALIIHVRQLRRPGEDR